MFAQINCVCEIWILLIKQIMCSIWTWNTSTTQFEEAMLHTNIIFILFSIIYMIRGCD